MEKTLLVENYSPTKVWQCDAPTRPLCRRREVLVRPDGWCPLPPAYPPPLLAISSSVPGLDSRHHFLPCGSPLMDVTAERQIISKINEIYMVRILWSAENFGLSFIEFGVVYTSYVKISEEVSDNPIRQSTWGVDWCSSVIMEPCFEVGSYYYYYYYYFLIDFEFRRRILVQD